MTTTAGHRRRASPRVRRRSGSSAPTTGWCSLRNDLVARFAAVDELYRQRHALLERQLELLSTALAAAAPRLEALRAACRQADAAREHAQRAARRGERGDEPARRRGHPRRCARAPAGAVGGRRRPARAQRAARRRATPRSTSRAREFNAAVARYNEAVRQFPTVLVARLFGFRAGGRCSDATTVPHAPTPAQADHDRRRSTPQPGRTSRRARRRRSPVARARRRRAARRAARAAAAARQQARARGLADRDRGDAAAPSAARARGEPVGRGPPALVRAAAGAHGGAAAGRAPGAAAGDAPHHGRARRRPADRPPALAGDAARPGRGRAAGGAAGSEQSRSPSGSSPTCSALAAYTAFLSRMVPGEIVDSAAGPRLVRRRDGDLAAVRRDSRSASRRTPRAMVEALAKMQTLSWMQRPVIVRNWVTAAISHSRRPAPRRPLGRRAAPDLRPARFAAAARAGAPLHRPACRRREAGHARDVAARRAPPQGPPLDRRDDMTREDRRRATSAAR